MGSDDNFRYRLSKADQLTERSTPLLTLRQRKACPQHRPTRQRRDAARDDLESGAAPYTLFVCRRALVETVARPTVEVQLRARVYLLKEDFQFFRDYKSWYWAGRFLDR
jgi:hypothetical protein